MNRFFLGAVAAVVLVGSVSACAGESDTPTAEAVSTASSSVAVPTTTRVVAEGTTSSVTPTPPPAPSTRASSASVGAEPVPATVAQSAEPVATSVPMPAVVCMNLQAAQNLIQDAGVFYSRSVDATGKGRNQVLDSNWIVVGQTPGVGAPIGEGDAILSVVKIGEPNPC